MKTVAIAIPSLHRPDLTARCIELLQAQSLPASDWEVVVIENDAQPGKILPDPLPPNTRRIELASNEGTTGSINRAVAATSSHYVLLLNNDIEAEPEYLAKLVGVLDDNPRLGFAVGKLLRATERTHLDGAGDAVLTGGGAYRLGHGDRDEGQVSEGRKIFSACGAAVLYRREAFVRCGGLDPDFFAYGDDLDLAMRVHWMGYEGLYVPCAVAYHIGSATLGESLSPKMVEWLTRNQFFLLAKNYPGSVLMRLLPRILAYQCLWFGYAVRTGNFAAHCKGIGAALRQWKLMRRKHKELMNTRRINSERFLDLLRESEEQVAEWHFSRESEERSRLLNTYFRLFPPKFASGGRGPKITTGHH